MKNTLRILSKEKSDGFTLIEVLIASLILFSSIAAVTLVYRGAFLSSTKAEQHITISGVLPSILSTIEFDLRNFSLTENPDIPLQHGSAFDVHYSWSAKLLKHESAPKKLDPDTGLYVIPPKKYKLWLVDLTINYNSLTKHYQFKKLGWNDA